MHWRSVLLLSVLAGCLTTGCRGTTPTSPSSASASTPPPASGSCDATRPQWAIGKPASAALLEQARVAADAETARFLRPNQPITLEYLGSRLNLGLDARDVVVAVVCG